MPMLRQDYFIRRKKEVWYLSITGQHEAALLVRANGQLVQSDMLDLGMIVGLVDDITLLVLKQQ
ncbi:MAG: hypothetical protein F6J87_05220 [Spirulina sp. SIO3F2]|nr:hypothetical protein [Spirulina sp. SIO3F2]